MSTDALAVTVIVGVVLAVGYVLGPILAILLGAVVALGVTS